MHAPHDALGGFRFRLPIQVRFRDLDGLGHVNNAVYLSYLEIVRTEYWREVIRPPQPFRFDYVIARVECDYRVPAQLDTPLQASMRMAGFGRTSCTAEYRIERSDSGLLIAAARTVQVFLDAEGRPAPVDPAVRRAVEAFEGRA